MNDEIFRKVLCWFILLINPSYTFLIHVSNNSLSNVFLKIFLGLGHVTSMVYSATKNTIYIGDVENKQILKLDIDEYIITPFMTSLNQGVR